jgi:putative oxidoreductase
MQSIPARSAALAERLERTLSWLPAAAARLTVGWVFFQSGWGKLNNLDGVVRFFSGLGIPAPELQAPLVAVTEFVCGGLLLLGLGTRLAAAPLVVVMVVALLTALADQIHGISDLFGLAEFCYVVLLVGLIVLGAGRVSLDALLARRFARGS